MIEDLPRCPPHESMRRSTPTGPMRASSPSAIWASASAPAKWSPPIDFQLTACEREVFEAQLQLEGGRHRGAAALAYESMLHGATALLDWQVIPHGTGSGCNRHRVPSRISTTRSCSSIRLPGGKFAQYFFQRTSMPANRISRRDRAPPHRRGAALYRGRYSCLRQNDRARRLLLEEPIRATRQCENLRQAARPGRSRRRHPHLSPLDPGRSSATSS